MGSLVDLSIKTNIASIVIIFLSGITCLSIFIFCKMHHVQVAEIEEYYAMHEQHRSLHYLFKICMFVIGVSLAYNMKTMVFNFFEKVRDHILKRYLRH
jgi:hypothetical protein